MAPASSVKRRLLPLATLLVAAVLNPVGSFANPTGANVTGGVATVSGQGTSRVTIDQSSDRAFIEWNSFSVAKGESVRFNQPSASSVTANKVVGVAPSDILGAVSANGRIILINPNGIFFGKGSTVDAAGLIATTLDLDKDAFLAGGKLRFSSAADISASVVNEGTLTISDAGLGALVAPHVRNSGALVANLGTAVLASGKAFTVDFTGDGLITFALGEGLASTLVGADGQPLKAQVEQAGEVTASRIVLSAAAAREVVNQSVNVSGLVRASAGARNADGSISLRGSNSVAVAAGAEVSGAKVSVDADNVAVAGNVSASSIQLTGEHIAVLTGATLSSNGGSILVGGDWQGSNAVRQALITTLAAGATIDAGQGGTAVLWSDITNTKSVTTVAGTVRSLGGRIETSGHLLELPGVVQAGAGGTWLIDPTNVIITTTSTTGTLAGDLASLAVTNIKATDIQSALNAGTSVTVYGSGTITVSTALTFANNSGTDAILTLDSTASGPTGGTAGTNTSAISINAAITATGTSQTGLRIRTKGAPISTTAGITLTGLIDFDNTVGLGAGPATTGTAISLGGALVTSRGDIRLEGKGIDGIAASGVITVGGAGFIRALTMTGTATTGTGVTTSAALSATGAITLTGYTALGAVGVNVGSTLASTLGGDVILAGTSGQTLNTTYTTGVTVANAVTVAGGNLIVQGAALVGGVASPVSGSAATGSRHGFTSAALGDLSVAGNISIAGHSLTYLGHNSVGDIISTGGTITIIGSGTGNVITGEVRSLGDITLRGLSNFGTGLSLLGALTATRGHVVIEGKGIDGIAASGVITVGGAGFIRALTMTGTATTGTGVTTSAALSATGAITLTGYTALGAVGVNVGSTLASTLGGDVILAGTSGQTLNTTYTTGVTVANAVTVAGGNLIVQGAALVGGVASPVSGSAATGSRHGFTSAALGDLSVAGNISIAGHSLTYLGHNSVGDIISTGGTITIIGSGTDGLTIGGVVRAGSGSDLRSLFITGTGRAGHGISTTAAGTFSATGSVNLTGYSTSLGHAITLNNFVRSTVAGDIVLSAYAAGGGTCTGLAVNGPVTAGNGGITVQGAQLIGGVATPAPGTPSTSRQSFGFNSALAGTLTATGDIHVRAASLDVVVGARGMFTYGDILSTLGNVSLSGSGVWGLDLQGAVTAGSGSTIRNITLSGYSDRSMSVAGGGYAIQTFLNGTLAATGDIILNGFGSGAMGVLNITKAVTSTVRGNIVFSASDSSTTVATTAQTITSSLSAANGSITLQGASYANGVVSPAPGVPATANSYGIWLNGTAQTLSATGDITILGKAGSVVDSSGVWAIGDYNISITSSLGDITILGTSGVVPNAGAINSGYGVRLDGAAVTALVGDITITGTSLGGSGGLYLGKPITALNSPTTPTGGGLIRLNGSTADGAYAYYGLITVATAPIRAWGPVVLYGQSAPVSFANWWTRAQSGGADGILLRSPVRSFTDSVTLTGYALGVAYGIRVNAGAPIEAAQKITLTGIGTTGAIWSNDSMTATGDIIIDGLTTSAASGRAVSLNAGTGSVWSKAGNIGITGQSGGSGLHISTNLLAGNAATPTSGGSISLSGKGESALATAAGLQIEASLSINAWGPIILYGQIAPVNTANWWTLADTTVSHGTSLSSPVRSFDSSVTITGYSSGQYGFNQPAAGSITAATTISLTSIGSEGYATLLNSDLIAGGDITIASTAARADVMSLYMPTASKTIWSKGGDIRITIDSRGPGADLRSPILAGNAATPTSGGSIGIQVTGGGNYRGLYTAPTGSITAYGNVSLYGSNAAVSTPNWWTIPGFTGNSGVALYAPVRSITGNLAITGYAGGSLQAILVDTGAPLTAAGTVMLEGRGKAQGITLADSISAGGDISLIGRGHFADSGDPSVSWGINTTGTGMSIVSTAGNITLLGEAPEGGVRFAHALRAGNIGLTAGGSINVSGKTETNGTFYGVFTTASASVQAWGSIDIYGQAAPVGTANWWSLPENATYDGVYLAGLVRSHNGALTVTGYSAGANGVQTIAGGSLQAATTLSVTGVGKTRGVRLMDNLLAGGDISLSGQVSVSTGSFGVQLGDGTKSTRSTGGSLKIVGSTSGGSGIDTLHALAAGSSTVLIANAPTNTFSKVGVLLQGTTTDATGLAVRLAGNLTNNTVGGDTTILATGGLGYADVAATFITNGPNAGRVSLSAIGTLARIAAGSGATITQRSGGGAYLATNDGGDLTPHKIVNDGTGWVVIAAGTGRAVGDGLGGQIVGLNVNNSITSPNGNVYLFSGLPSTTTNLHVMSAKMTTLTLDTVAFEQAYGAGNVGVTVLPEAALNLAKSTFASTTTASALGPFVQFRGKPTYNFLLTSAVTYAKVYGTEDPTTPYGSATTAGTLLNLVDTRLQKNASNGGWDVATGSIVVPSGTGYTIKLNWATILAGLSVGQRAALGTLAGEQASPTTGYAYPVGSTHGLQFTAATGTTQPGTNAPLRLLITKRPLTITTDSDSKTYGDAYTVSQFANISAYDEVTPAGIVGFKSVNGVILRDQLGTFTVSSGGAAAGANAGAYTIVPTALAVTGVSGLAGSSTDNYNVTYVNGTLTVNKALVTLSLKNNSVNAGGPALNIATYSTNTANYDFSGLKNSQTTTTLTGALTFDGSATTVVQAPGVYEAGQGTLATSNANYNVVLASGNVYRVFDANPGLNRLVVRAPILSVAYGDDPASAAGITTYFHNGAVVTPAQLATYATGTVIWTPGATRTDNVGSYGLTGSGLTPNVGYTIVYDTTSAESLSIVPRAVTLSATKVYDGTVTFTGGQIAVGGTVSGQTLTVTGSVNARSADVEASNIFLNPTALTLVSGSGLATNYRLAGATSTVTITPRPLTVSGTKVYDAATSVAAEQLAVGGALAGEVVLLSAGTATLGAADVGTYQGGAFTGGAISVSGPTGRAANYALPATFGTITVTPATVRLAASKVYDGTTGFTPSAHVVATGVAGQTLAVTGAGLTANSARVANANSLSGLGGLGLANGTGQATNYTLVGATTIVRITPRPIGVTLTNANVTKVYDGTADLIGAIVPTYATSNLLAGDTVILGAAAVKFNTARVATATSLVASGLSINTLASSSAGSQLSDYAVSGTASVAATITPITLTLGTLGTTSKVYDGTAALTGNLAITNIPVTSGLIAGDTVAFAAGAAAAYNSADVVSANRIDITGVTLTSVVSRSGSSLSDYVVPTTTIGYQAAITPKLLTLTGTKSFDGTSLFAVNQLSIASGQLAGESLTLLSARGTTQSAAAGSYNQGTFGQTAISVVGGRALASNYIVSTQGALYINPGVLALNVTGSKAYDATADFSGAILTATAPNGAIIVLTGTGVANSADVLGAATLSDYTGLTAAPSTTPSVSYTLAGATSTVRIRPKSLIITGSVATTKVYDGTPLTSVTLGTLSGLIGMQTIVVTGSGQFADANVGAGKLVRVHYSLADGTNGGRGSNYVIPIGDLGGSITPRALTLSNLGVPASKVYDGTTAATVTGAGALAGVIIGDVVTLNGLAQGVYDSKDVATATGVRFSGLTLGGASAGNYTIAANYLVPATITPKPLTVTGLSVAASKVYDGTTSAAVTGAASFGGLLGGDTVTLGGTPVGAYNSKDVAAAVSVSLAGLTLAGVSATNYSLAMTASLLATITPKTLTVSGLTVAASKAYDGTTSAVVTNPGVLAGIIGVDAVAIGGTAVGLYNSKDVASANTVSFAGLTLGGADARNYLLAASANAAATITKATLTVGANADARFVGQTDASGFNGANYVGFVAGETAATAGLGGTVTITRSNAGVGAAGTYAGVLTPGGLTAANYQMNYVAGDYTIVPAGQLLVRVANATAAYGSAPAYVISSVEYLTTSGSVLTSLTAGATAGSTYTYNDGAGGTATFTLGASGAPTPGGALPVGNYALTGSGLSQTGGNFIGTPTFVGNQAVTPRLLASSATKRYDGTDLLAAADLSLSGILAGDTVTASGAGRFVFTSAGSAKGYNLGGITLQGAEAGNYSIDTQGLALNGVITARTLTITALAATKIYDGLAFAGGNGVSFAGFENGEDAAALGGALAYGGAAQGAINAGSYALTVTGLTSDNYVLSYLPGTLSVNRAALTVVANDASRLYGDANPTFTTALSGFVAGQDATSAGVTGTGVVTTTATSANSVGTYALTADAGTYAAANYVFTDRMDGRLTVAPAALTVTVAATAREYGSANPGFVATLAGFKNGDTLATATSGSLSFTSVATATSRVGAYQVVADGLLSPAGNYTFNQDVANATALTITPATLTVTSADLTKTYDGAAFAGRSTLVYAGFRNDDDRTVLAGSLAFTGSSQGAINAGMYAITPSGLLADNYTLAYVPGTLTVAKVGLTMIGSDASREYGAADPAFSATFSGFVNGETFANAGITGSAGGTSSAGATSSVGTYAYTPAVGTLSSVNYTFTQSVDGRVTITPATLSIVANAATRAYGDVEPAFMGSVSGLRNGDTVAAVLGGALTFTTNATVASNVGNYGLSGSGLSVVSANYVLTQATANATALTITRATLVGTVANATRTYDGVAFTGGAGVSYVGFRNGEQAGILSGTLVYGGVSQGATDAGAYALIAGGPANANYTLSFVPGTLTVAPKTLTATLVAPDKTYDGTTAATGTLTLQGLVGGQTLGSSLMAAFNAKNVAQANLVTVSSVQLTDGTGRASNYVLAPGQTAAARITPRSVVVTGVTALGRVYDATTRATLSGIALVTSVAGAGDTPVVVGTPLATFTDANAGGDKSVTVTGYALSGVGASNYALQAPAGLTATIAQATLSVLANADAKLVTTSDALNFNGVSYAGFVGADTAAVVGGSLSVTRTNAGTQSAGVYAGVLQASGLSAQNYTMNYVGGDFTIVPAGQLLIRAGNGSATYGSAPAFTISSVEYLTTGGQVLTGLTAVGGSGNSFQYSDGASGTVDFTLGAADAVASAGGNLRVGNYTATATSLTVGGSNFSGTATVVGALTVTPLARTVTGVTAQHKNYDRTNSATFTGGVIASLANDAVSVVGTGVTATFADKNVGSGKAVRLFGFTLTGADAVNYRLVQPADVLADITVPTLTITGVTALHKVYDRTRMAILTGGVINPLLGDDATLVVTGATGLFADADVADGKSVVVSGYTVIGADAANYLLVQPTGVTANITPLTLTLSGLTATDRVYDGTTSAAVTGSLSGMVAGDTVSLASLTGSFVDKNVAAAKTVNITIGALNGAQAGNYRIVNTTTTAEITRLASVIWTGGAGNSNWFDPANWAGGAVPDLANVANVILPAGANVSFAGPAVAPAVFGPVSIDSLGTSGSLTIAGGTLNVAAGGVSLDSLAVTGGTLTNAGATTATSFTQSGGIFAGTGAMAFADFTQTAGTTNAGGDFTVTNSYAQTNPGVINVGGNVGITHAAGPLVMGNLSTTGNLSLTSLTGPISQSAGSALVAHGLTSATASAGGQPADITLSNAGNDLRGMVTVSGANVGVATSGNLAIAGAAVNLATSAGGATSFGQTTLTGGLTTTSVGAITQTGPIVTGAPSSITSTTGSITLTDPNNSFFGATSLSGLDVTVAAAGNLNALIAATGNASVEAYGNLTVGGTANNLATTSGGTTLFGLTTLTGGLTTASVGDITQTGAITTGAPSSISSSTGDIDLTNPNNSWFGATSLSGVDVAIAAAGSLNALIAATGDASASASGNLTVGGTAFNLTTTSGGSTSFGTTTLTGALTTTSVGDITQTGAITTGAPSSITSTAGDIDLSNPNNSFFGATTLSGVDVSVVASGNLEALIAATGNASVTAAGNLIVGGTANNLATTSGGTTSFGVTTLTGGLNTSSVGDITQTGAITTGAPSSIASTTGDITLTNPNNSFFGATTLTAVDVAVAAAGNLSSLIAASGDASVTAAGNLTVGGSANNLSTSSAGTTSFGVTTLTGALNTSSAGDITQTGAITTGAPSSITSTAGDITLNNAGNSFFGATNLVATLGDLSFAGSVTGNLNTSSGGATSFGVTTVTGALSTTSVGDITQVGAITTGAPSSITSTTGDITLNNAGNSFFGATTLSGVDVSVAAVGNLEALIAATGDASVTSAGNLIVGGTAVNLSTSSGGTTSFGATTLTGGLTTTSVGDITQTGAITTGAPSSITSSTGDITLTNPGNSFFGATSLSGVDVAIAALGNLNALIGASGNASASATGSLTVGGTANNLTTTSGGATSFGVTTLAGALTTTSVGDISQTGAITTGAPSSITSSTGDIDLSNPGNSFFGATSIIATIGDLGFGGTVTGDLTTSAGGATTFAATTVNGNLGVTSGGDITQTGPLIVTGTSSLASLTGDIDLTNPANQFGGQVTASGVDVAITALGNLNALIAASGNASASATGSLTIGGTANILTTTSGGATSFGVTTLTGALTSTSVGDITQTGPIITGAASSITSSTGDIDLSNPGNSFFGATSIIATIGDLGFGGTVTGDLTTSAGGATTFAATTVNGNLGVTSGGDITQTGPLIVTGTSSLASFTGDIDLTNPANQFSGQVTASGVDVAITALGNLNALIAASGNASASATGSLTVGGTANNLTTTSGGATSFGVTTLTGALTSTSVGDITQTGPIITGAASSITSTTGDITLTNPSNSFFGATSVIATVGDINFGGTVNGNLGTNAGGATSFAATTVNGNLGVVSGGDITQTGPLIVTGTSSLASLAGNIDLTNPANQFGGQVTASGRDIDLTATGNLMIDINATGATTLGNTGNLTVTGVGVGLTATTTGNLGLGNLSLSGNMNLTAQGSATIATGANVIVLGLASLTSPESVLNQNGTSIGIAAKPPAGNGASGVATIFVLNAARFNPSSLAATNNTQIDGDSGVFAAGRDGGPAGIRSVVPTRFVVQPVVAPAPAGVATGYFTAGAPGLDGPSFRFIYPKVNLGEAYYVGALSGDDAQAAGVETK